VIIFIQCKSFQKLNTITEIFWQYTAFVNIMKNMQFEAFSDCLVDKMECFFILRDIYNDAVHLQGPYI